MVLGAAIGGAIPSIPEWGTAMDAGLTGGVMLEMMRSVGGFGKFVTVIIAFTPLGNLAGTLYSISIQLQVLTPFFYRIPRYAFSVVITAIIIGVAIPISKTLFISLENFLGCISYWAGVYVGVITIEHLVFRKAKAANYDPGIWNDGNKLPLGIAAVAAAAIPFGLIVPCMAQNWYTGPIARTTGDIGFLVGLPLSMILYFVFRTFEIRFAGR
jgi:purine-cytosine permease-like protein